jgi:hypothetical protein
MASLPSREEPGDYHQVQMLGANLVIKTERLDGVSAPKSVRTSWKWPAGFSVSNLQDKKSVYPWFSNVHVKMMEFNSESDVPGRLIRELTKEKTPPNEGRFVEILKQILADVPATSDDYEKLSKLITNAQDFRQRSVYVCAASESDPSDITPKEGCKLKEDRRIHVSGSAVIYDLPLDPDREGRFSAVTAGKNYALILGDPNEKRNCGDEKLPCVRFSVHQPFFYYPNSSPVSGDPDPYVFLEKEKTAIFGVVDRTIGEQVGVLNFSWFNQDDKLKTVVSAEDPVEALEQQLEYFKGRHPGFTGLKILLAQMSPPLARVLAAHFPEFQVVVTATSQEQSTSETVLSTVWSPASGARAGAFVAVPSYYADLKQAKSLEGTLHFGAIKAEKVSEEEWRLSATKSLSPLPVPRDAAQTQTAKAVRESYSMRVDSRLKRCVSGNLTPSGPIDRIKWLALCAMREQTGADVALIQKRDFYTEFPADEEYDPMQAQQVLDRVIWKGDLLTLLYVPGSALKKALDQSTKFDNEDANKLSLADEKSRGLEYVGVKKVSNQYLVNEAPIDDKKLYAVATSDYIGAGDTGYPDLAAASLNPKGRPTQFPEQLRTISSIVCGELNPSNRFERCLDELTRDEYLDSSNAEPTTPPSQLSLGKRLWKLEPFKWPAGDEKSDSTDKALEQKAQHHPIWMLSLKNFSLGFLSLSNNLTDAQVGQKFAAVSTSGVTAKKSHTITIGLGTRLSRSSHLNEFFVSMGIDYSEQAIGDLAPNISQLKNRLTGDAGLIRNIKGGRSKDRVGITFTLHVETPLQQPFTTFTLGTKDKDPLKITQNRSVLLLPRIGMRWQNGDNFFEVGGQVGREIQAFSGYRFNTQGSIVECLPSATQTFAACITEKSTSPMTAITKDSVATAIFRNRPRAGLYWKYGLSIPFGSKVKYDINQEGNQEADFFFNFDQDNSADTRFLDRSKHSLKFTIWPSFSIGPSLQFLLYRNKVNHDFLFQKQFGFEANFTFNLSNHREKMVQIKHKP